MCNRLSGWLWAALVLVALGTPAQSSDLKIEPTVNVSRSTLDPLKDVTPGAVLRGTVSGVKGLPLEGISVSYSFVHSRIGSNIYDRVRTGTDGTYELQLPWAGVAYNVRTKGHSYEPKEQRVQASAEQRLNFVLEPQVYNGPELQENFVYGIVREAASGSAVPGVEIVQSGTGDAERRVTTDAKGAFTLSLSEPYYWSQIYARHNGLITPTIRAYGNQDHTVELLLESPGSLVGIVTTMDDGLPAADCPIVISRKGKRPALSIEGRTDEKGYYRLEKVPTGEYLYVVNAPRRGDYEDEFTLENTVRIAPGAPTQLDIQTEKHASISGRVTGPSGEPVAFAKISARNLRLYSRSIDEEGRFTATLPKQSGNDTTGHAPRLTAFHPRYGYGEAAVPDVGPGEEKGGVEIRLNGMTRLSGVLRDRRHKPIANVKILETLTDEAGYFDSGPIAVPLDPEGLEIKMDPPRPSDNAAVREDDEDPRYYYAPPFRVSAQHGEDIHLDIQLEEAPLRIFHGIVRDAAGQPQSDIPVHLYAGMPTTSQWLRNIAPHYPAIAQTAAEGPRPATLVARAVTDAQGQWRIQMVREVVRKSDTDTLWGLDEYHADNIVLFASDVQQRTMAMSATRMETDYAEIEVPLVLRLPPADLAIAVKVVDGEGQPIPGVAWVLNTFHGPYVTDADGLLSVPRVSGGVDLRLLARGYRIVAAEEAKAPPRESASRTGGIPFIGTYYQTHIGRRAPKPSPPPELNTQESAPPPPFKVADSYVRFPFVTDENVAVEIGLEAVGEVDSAK